MVKAGAMALKAVVPSIPKNARDRELLEGDLRWIGCHGFMGKPWGATDGGYGSRIDGR